MSNRISVLVSAACVSVMSLALAACNDHKSTSASTPVQPVNAPQAAMDARGVLEVDGVTATATVQAINPQTRTITLLWDGGVVTEYVARPEMRNFAQIRVGDRVRATVVEGLAVAVVPANNAPSAAAEQVVALAPKGSRPGILMANTVQVVAKVTAIDTANRTVTLTGVSGTPRTVRVSSSVDLSRLQVGDDVAARVTEAMAVVVEAP